MTNVMMSLFANRPTLYIKPLLRYIAVIAVVSCALAASTVAAAPPEVDNNGGATVTGPTNATLNGAVTAINGAAIEHARIYFGTTDGGTNAPLTWDATNDFPSVTGVETFSTNVTGLLYGQTYYYTVYASNANGEAWSDVAAFKTLPPPEAEQVIATTNGTEGVSGLVDYNDGGSFGGTSFIVKNAGATSNYTRKGYVRFDISSIDATLLDASLELVIAFFNLTADTTIKVYGITNQALDSVSLDNNLTWANAPANDPTSGYAADLTKAELLGDFTVLQTGDATGNTKSFTSAALVDFLNADTNGVVTLVLGALADTAPNISFAGDTHSSYAPPALNLRQSVRPIAITNTVATNVTETSADVVGILDATNSVFKVYAYVSESNNTSEAEWLADGTATNVLVGTYTNVTDHSVTGTVSGLTLGTRYYYTLMATNDATRIWASPNVEFTTVGPPEVDNNGGATVTGPTNATLNGAVTAINGAAIEHARIYFGTTDGGTNAPLTWDATNDFPSVTGVETFSTNVTGLLYGQTYYYTVYASNANGEAWSPVTSFTTVFIGPRQADGGTVTNYTLNGTNFYAHIFTSDGNFVADRALAVDYLIVGGGGAGGNGGDYVAGGGGGGGEVKSSAASFEAATISVVVGAGGVAANDPVSGSNSSLGAIVAAGGGGGGRGLGGTNSDSRRNGLPGGSGGGATASNDNTGTGGASTAADGGLGYAGGNSDQAVTRGGAGGGGAGGAGSSVTGGGGSQAGGAGGSAVSVSITGTAISVGGGGGGGGRVGSSAGTGGANAGDGSNAEGTAGESGTANRGGGGGGGSANSNTTRTNGGNGGSGIVVVRYKVLPTITNTGGTNVTDTSADVTGILDATNAVVTVYAYVSESNNTSEAEWLADGTATNVLVGTYTNVTDHSVTGSVSGLTLGTDYYYTLMATNDATRIWASPNVAFTTFGPAEVSNAGGATATGPTTATLSGAVTATNGAAIEYARIYFGTTDGGTNAPLTWDATNDFSAVTGVETFSTNVTGLLYGQTYYYTVYASNAYGEAWSPVTSFTTLPSWTPAVETAWLSAWYDAADTSSITASGGTVSQWRDKSGNNFHVSQTNSAKRPATGSRYINAKNVLNFDGAADTLQRAYESGLNPSSLSVLTVTACDTPTDGAYQSPLTSRILTNSMVTGYIFYKTSWNTFAGYYGYTAGYRTLDGPAATTAPYMQTLTADNSGGAYYFNGSLQAENVTDGYVPVPGGAPFFIGAGKDDGSDYYWDGAIAEVIVLDSVLTLSERQKLEGYLAHKWGLDGNLPAGHPYENAAPGVSAITNTVATNVTDTSAEVAGILDATNAVFSVYAYVSESNNTTEVEWLADGTATNVLVGTYTNVTDHSVTGTVSGLTLGTDYYYTLMATNDATRIWASSNVPFTTDISDGQVVIETGDASDVTDSSAVLNATLSCPGTTADVITYWWITGDSTTNSATNAYGNVTESNVTHTATGLQPLTAYSFTVRATNDTQDVSADTTNTFTTAGPPVVDTAGGATVLSTTTATLHGQVTATNGAAIAHARIYFGTTDGGTNAPLTWDAIHAFPSVTGVETFSTEVTGLLYGQTYYYRVYASNEFGEAWSTVTNFVTVYKPTLAEGGTVTNYNQSGTDYMAHIFTGNGNFVADRALTVDYLIVGGGGAGGANGGGGGGAGGLIYAEGVTVTSGGSVTVGAGGSSSSASGADSTLTLGSTTLTARGGGGGGDNATVGKAGGSGGGGGFGSAKPAGGSATQPFPGFGNAGGAGGWGSGNIGGGGGGADAAGATGIAGGNGGAGKTYAITGSEVGYAGGGGGGIANQTQSQTPGSATDGGGAGGVWDAGAAATANTGGGGGGGSDDGTKVGGAGGSGIVVVRYAVLEPTITNTVAVNATTDSVDLTGILDAPDAVFDVYAYYSTNSTYATSAQWDAAVLAGDAVKVSVGTFTDVAEHTITHTLSGLAGGSYYYTLMAENDATSIWASPSKSFFIFAGSVFRFR